MRIAIVATSALALAISGPVLAQGKGNGNGNGNGHAAGEAKPGKGNDKPRGNGKADDRRGGPPAARGNGNGNGNGGGKPEKAMKEIERGLDRQVEQRIERGANRAQARPIEQRAREAVETVADQDARRVLSRYERDFRPVENWCPPGLAKKNNGCMPPGQAKKLTQDRFGGYYGSAYPRLSGDDWRYYDGYAYRQQQGGLIGSLIPLVGGALFGGNQWPSAYDDYRAPAYYGNYFGRNPADSYYYADRTLFSVDPDDRRILGIAALLTGDDITVGQPLPSGYDVYNVPYAYRGRYADGPDAMYRYSDGYVYQVDPKTRLVAAAIDLLT